MKLQDEDITPRFLNDKIESLASALFDSIHQFEERQKEQEKHIVELKNKLRMYERKEK